MKQKKLVIFYPPLHYKDGIPINLDVSVPPLGAMYVAAYVNMYSELYEAVVYDVGAKDLSITHTPQLLNKFAADVIGISAFTPQLQGALELARCIKKSTPFTPVFLGGAHVSADPDIIERYSDIFDYGICGEGEQTFLDSLHALHRNESVERVQQAKAVFDIDVIPFPDRISIDRELYGPRESMIFSRGCPYKCYYCSRPSISKIIRYRSPQNLIEEIETVYGYSKGAIDFQDDTFTLKREPVMEFCRLIKAKGLKLNWHCNSRIDTVDDELLEAMRDAGCTLIHFGIESANDELRRTLIQKGSFGRKQIINVFNLCKKLKIKIGAYFMIGHKGETLEQIDETRKFILSAGIDVLGVSIPTPFPGSSLYKIAEEEGIISTQIIDDFAEKRNGEGYAGNYPVYIDQCLSADLVYEKRKKVIRQFYMQPRIICSMLRNHLTSFSGLRKLISDGWSVLLRGSSVRQPYKPSKDILALISPFAPPNVGGLETHLKYYLDFLTRRRVHTAVLTYKALTTSGVEWVRRENMGTVDIRRYWWFGRTLFDTLAPYPVLEFLYMVPKLLFHSMAYALWNCRRIKAYHAHGLIAAFIVRLTSMLVPARKVVSTHYIYNLKNRKFFSKIFMWIFNDFDMVLAVGKESMNDLTSVGYPPEKVMIYNHSIDNELFKPINRDKLREKWGVGEGIAVLFVGRLLKMKGVLKLIRIAENNPDIQMLFVGVGILNSTLENAAGQNDNIHFYGRRQGIDLVELYNLADMLVLPSVEEGSSLVVLEALSCGKPVLVTNRGCSKNMFPDRFGAKFEPTEENILQAVRDVYTLDLKALEPEIRAFAIEEYGEKNLKKILDITLGEL